MLLCLPSIGVPIFEKPSEPSRKVARLSLRTKGAVATGYESSDGFVVVAGSTAAMREAASIQAKTKALRVAFIEDGTLKKKGKHLEFTNDYVFGSPSLAASVVAANNCSGREFWKDETGRTLKQIQEKEAGKNS